MPQNNEVIGLLVATGILIFLLANRKLFATVFSDRFLMLSFIFYFASFFFTVVEDISFFSPSLRNGFNYAEHVSRLTQNALFLFWIWIVFGSRKEKA